MFTTSGGLWYNVYTTEYTTCTNHNPLVVYRHLTTGGMWYNVYTTEYITIHLLYIDTLQQVECDIIYIQQNTPQITFHLLYIDTLQQVNCDIMYIQQSVSQSTGCI